MKEVIIDGVAYVPKPEKPKQDIRDYCREHRVWAAKDTPNVFGWYVYQSKPRQGNSEYCGTPDTYLTRYVRENCTFPDCPWNKSLIAPDGSMPLMRNKEARPRGAKFEVGKWYLERCYEERGPGQIKGRYNSEMWVVYFPQWTAGHDGCGGEFRGRFLGHHCYWVSEENLIPTNAPTKEVGKGRLPRRGDPVFVWDCSDDPRCPAIILYFHHITDGGEAFCFVSGGYGKVSTWQTWDHYRSFDVTLVGVPRKDWPEALA